ncbi:sugar transferase [Leisingera sp. S232]|uniref:sugar transferase n=1 Tax=Leisingera sp. S232 TaxID=3415132 RepID=UPI0008691A19|nr:exopolysaccharide biosynthesis protein [Rhodobacteraceae bacterium (ex Bugula neritina AB1)]
MKNVTEYQGQLKNFEISGGRKGIETAERMVWEGLYRRVGKRVFDLFLAAALLPLIAPLIAILWLITRCGGGTGFFGHARVGRGGCSFKCWKIRTMVPDAEEKLQSYLGGNPDAAREWEASRKLAHDPRITRFGDFLRKSSLDELPQIWNVLCGDMSFVGPRPVTGEELGKYGGRSGSYLAQKPGITGIWQVSGRNSVSYEDRVSMDHRYLRNMSFPLDLMILFKTWLVVIRRTGC